MPLGFTPGSLLGIQRHYGDQLLAGIEQGGKVIEQGLRQITTKRQLEGLGQTLSQINPDSPDYPQQLIRVGAQFPFAMQDPRGQALMSLGVKQHNEWKQTQLATQRADAAFSRQKEMQGIRQRDAMSLLNARNEAKDPGVDLSGFNDGLPKGVTGTQPPSRGSMITTPQEDIPLFGQREGLGDIARSALAPLAEAQQVTGVKPTKSQAFNAIAAERTRRNQAGLQEDRQAASVKLQEDRQTAAEAAAEKRALAASEKADAAAAHQEVQQKRLVLNSELNTINRDISRLASDLQRHLKTGGDGKEFEGEKARLEKLVEDAGAERTRIQKELDGLTEGKKERFRYENGKLVPQ